MLRGERTKDNGKPLKRDQATRVDSYRNLNDGWDDSTRHSGHQIHLQQQVVEARVVAEGVPGWTDIARDQTAVSRLIGFFQALKGLVLLTQLCLDEGKIKGFSIILGRDRYDDPG